MLALQLTAADRGIETNIADWLLRPEMYILAAFMDPLRASDRSDLYELAQHALTDAQHDPRLGLMSCTDCIIGACHRLHTRLLKHICKYKDSVVACLMMASHVRIRRDLPSSHFPEGETEEVHEKQQPIHYHALLPRKYTQSDLYTDKHTNTHKHAFRKTRAYSQVYTRIEYSH